MQERGQGRIPAKPGLPLHGMWYCGTRMDWWSLDRPQLSPSNPYSPDDLDPVWFTAYLLFTSKKWSWQCLLRGITFSGLIKRSKLPLVSSAILVKVGPQIPAADAVAVGLNIRLEYRAVNKGKAYWILEKDSNQILCKEPILPFGGWFFSLGVFLFVPSFSKHWFPLAGLEP